MNTVSCEVLQHTYILCLHASHDNGRNFGPIFTNLSIYVPFSSNCRNQRVKFEAQTNTKIKNYLRFNPNVYNSGVQNIV